MTAPALVVCAFVAACGGAQPSQALRVTADGDVYVVGDHVQRNWAGRTWSGSPSRLAMEGAAPEGPECSTDFVAVEETIHNPANVAAGTLHESEHVVLTIRGWSPSAGCASAGDWTVSRVGHGGLLFFDGPADAETPEQVLARGGRIVTMRGWSVEHGQWAVGDDPVAAVLSSASETAAVACLQSDGRAAAERLASALLYAALGSPTTVADAENDRAGLIELHGGPLPGLLAGEASAIPSGCLTSPVFQVALVSTRRPVESTDAPSSAAEATLHALAAFDAMEWIAASEAIDLALEATPGYGPALLLRGRIEEEVNVNLAAAADAFAGAARDDRLESIARFRLGVLQEDLGEIAAASGSYEASANADLAYAPPVNALGFIAFEAERLDESRVHFEEALRRDPTFAQAANNLGFIAETADADPVAAATWYERSIAADANSAAAHVNLASVAIRHLGRIGEGEELLRTALSLDPRNEDALTALESVLERPSAVADVLAGTWSGVDAETGGSLTATFTADGGFGLVTRPPGGEPSAIRVSTGEPADHRTQRVFRADDDAWVVELQSDTELHLYRSTDPLARNVLTRHAGGIAMSL